jgi:hypothetical protein
VTFRKLDVEDYHSVLREIEASGETRIILDSTDRIIVEKLLKQAQQLRLTTPAYHYLLSTLVQFGRYCKKEVAVFMICSVYFCLAAGRSHA